MQRMAKTLTIATVQIVFFYYFMWVLLPVDHLSHLMFDRIFNIVLYATMAIGIVFCIPSSPRSALVLVVSPWLSVWVMGVILRILKPYLFGVALFTYSNIAIFYMTLAVVWYTVPVLLQIIIRRPFDRWGVD